MYSELISDIQNVKEQAKTWYTDKDFDTKPEWFANVYWCNLYYSIAYVIGTIFGNLVMEKCQYNGERWTNEVNEAKVKETLNKLAEEFLLLHHTADKATDTILLYLDDLEHAIINGNMDEADRILNNIDDVAFTYQKVHGICWEFATELCSDNKTHEEFWDGDQNFPDDGILELWVQQMHSKIKRIRTENEMFY